MARRSLFDLINNASKEEKDYAAEFLTDLDYFIKKSESDSKKEISHTFKPSSIRCPRCAVMQVLGQESNKETRNSNLIGITQAGTFIHQLMQQTILDMPDWEFVDVGKFAKKNKDLIATKPCDFNKSDYETKFHSKKWNMNFLVDGIIKYDNKYFILEIKSIGSSGFFKTKEVPEKYKQQAISYCVLLGLDSVLFLFVDRDLFNKKVFLFTPTQQEKDSWINQMLINMQYVSQNTIPEKPKNADKQFCQYCNYSETCDKIGEQVYKIKEEEQCVKSS